MQVSVIIPCRNEEQYVGECLEAMLCQTYPKNQYEVILVDNMSTDGTLEVTLRYPEVTLIQESKLSSYAARNAGVRLSTGRILAFTDADCVAEPDWLQTIVKELSGTDASLIIGSRRFGHEGLIVGCLADYEHEKARFVYDKKDPALYYAYTNNLAVARSAYERCGPFEEIARGGDVLFTCEVIRAFGCDAVKFVPAMRVRHLEIDRWYSWHKKMWIYGRSYRGYHMKSKTRPLSYGDRFKILLNASRYSRYSLLYAMFLLLSGIAATFAFEMGRRIPRFR